MATIAGRTKGLADWILAQFDDKEIEDLVQLLGRGISVSSISNNSVDEFLIRAEAACLRASYQIVSNKEILGKKALRGLDGEVTAQRIQARFTKLFLDGPV